MKITSFMKQQHSKNRAAKRLKSVLSLVLAVSLMLSTLCILVLNAAAQVLPIDNDLVDGISMRLFNYGNGINRYMRNPDGSVGRLGDYYYNQYGMVDTMGGGFLPFVDGEAGSGGSVDRLGTEAQLNHTYPTMSTLLNANGMPVVNEPSTSTLYTANGLMKNYTNGSGITNNGVDSMYYDKGNEFTAIKYTPAASGSYTKSGFFYRTPGLNKAYDLVTDKSKITVTLWVYIDMKNKNPGDTITNDENGLLFAFVPRNFLYQMVSGMYTEGWLYRVDMDHYCYDKNGNKTTLIDGWNYISIPLTNIDSNNSRTNNSGLTPMTSYTSDANKQIEAFEVYENSNINVSKYNTFSVADVRVNHTDKGYINLIKDQYNSFIDDGTNIVLPTETGNYAKGTVTYETVTIDRNTTKDAYYCDVTNKYAVPTSWYDHTISNSNFTAVTNTNRKRGMVITTNTQIPYFMNYRSKYSLEIDIYFEDTNFSDGNAISQNMIISLLADGYVEDGPNNITYHNYTEDYAIRYLLFNEDSYNQAPTIKAGWNHLSIPLNATNWGTSTTNTAPFEKLVRDGKIAGISFHENNVNYTGTYDFSVGNIRIVRNNGTGIYPTYYGLVTVNDFGSNTVYNSNYLSTVTSSVDGLKGPGTNALQIDDAAYCVTSTNRYITQQYYEEWLAAGQTGQASFQEDARKQGLYITTYNDDTDYRYLFNDEASSIGAQYQLSVWLYLEPKNKTNGYNSAPENNLVLKLIPEGHLNNTRYSSGTSNITSMAEHYIYLQDISDNTFVWGWNHILLDMNTSSLVSSSETNTDRKPAIDAFNSNGRLDGIVIHEQCEGSASAGTFKSYNGVYNLAVGEVSFVNLNDSGSLEYLFNPYATTHTSKNDYLAGLEGRLSATGDDDYEFSNDSWPNSYDDSVYSYQSVYLPVNSNSTGLFQYDKATGTYYYKSNHNAATYNMDTGKFDLYDYTINRYNKGYEYYTEGADAGYPLDSYANFYPFNTGHTQGVENYQQDHKSQSYVNYNGLQATTSLITEVDSTRPDGVVVDNYSLLQNSKETEVDLSYGFTFNFDFYMPKNGITAEGNEMIFSFTGDDDIWVYIDGVLFLDIGGAHPPRTGSINFATGVIKYQNLKTTSNSEVAPTNFEYTSIKAQLEKAKAELEAAGLTGGTQYTDIVALINSLVPVTYTDENGATQTGYTFKDYSMHKLDFFYLERGGSDSCCKIEFNLEPLPEQSLSVTKTVNDVNPGISGELYFTFKLTDENGAPITQWPYEICYKGTSNSYDGIQRYTGNDGTFIVVGETTALFKDIPVNTRFQIQEIAESQDSFTASNNITGNSLSTGVLTMPDTPFVVEYTNKPLEPKYNEYLQITKVVNGVDPIPDREFDMVLEFDLNRDDEYIPFTGTATKIAADGTQSSIRIVDGAFKLKANESIKITGLCPDLKYRVKELAPTQHVEGYEFIEPTINKVTCAFDEYAEFAIVSDADTNNEIVVYNTVRETYGDIRITKEGVENVDHHEDTTEGDDTKLGKEELQTTIFNIKGTEDSNDEVDFDVVITGNDSIVIRDLPVGVYDVTEKTDWSWRYAPDNTTKQVEVKAAGTDTSETLIDAAAAGAPVKNEDYGSTLIDSISPKGSVDYTTVAGEQAYSYVFTTNTATTQRKDGMYIAVGDKKMNLVGYEDNYTVKARVYISNIEDYYILLQFIPTDYLKTGESGDTAKNYVEYWAYRYTLSNEKVSFGTTLQQGWNTLEIPLSEFKSGLNENGTHTGPAFNAMAKDGRVGYVTVHENNVASYATEYTFAIKSVEIVSNMPELTFNNSRENIYYLSGDNVKVNTFNQ